MEIDSLDLFFQVLTISNTRTCLFKKDGSNYSQLDHGLHLKLYDHYTYDESIDMLRQKTRPKEIIRTTDEFLLSHIFLHIPEKYVPDKCYSLLSIGPFSTVRRSREEVYQILSRNGLPDQLLEELSAYYDSVPVIEESEKFEELVLKLATGLFQTKYRLHWLPEESAFLSTPADRDRQIKDNPQIALETIEERYKVENALMDAISSGDYNRAHALHQKFVSFYIRPRSENALHNSRHMSIILNTICRKAAESGGVHPLYIDDLSTRFAMLINELDNKNDVDAISNEIIHKYCLLVQNYAMKGYSSVTKGIISYIDFHYTEDLSLNFFAEMFNLTKTYLSNMFKKETGIRLTDFIHQVRMRKAITLINSASIPITAIATACGYNDINYFIRVFKKTYGLSPKQYRKSILRTTDNSKTS